MFQQKSRRIVESKALVIKLLIVECVRMGVGATSVQVDRIQQRCSLLSANDR